MGTNHLNPDSDDDGINDLTELELGYDPINPDMDEDGLLDGDDRIRLWQKEYNRGQVLHWCQDGSWCRADAPGCYRHERSGHQIF